MASRRIEGRKVVVGLVVLVVGLLIYTFYRYYTVEPALSPEEIRQLEERIEQEQAEKKRRMERQRAAEPE